MTTSATPLAPLGSARPAGRMLVLAAALVVGNLLTTPLLVAGTLSWHFNAFSRAVVGVLLAQLILLGIWLALGDSRWYFRLLAAVPLCFLSSTGVGLVENLAERSQVETQWAMIGFMFLMFVLAACVVVLPLRRLRAWRFTCEAEASLSPAARLGQANIADYLFWMIPFGGLLAVIRFQMSLQENAGGEIGEVFFFIAGLLAVVLAAMLTVFSTSASGWKKWVLLFALALLISLVLSAPEIYRGFQHRSALAGGSPTFLTSATIVCRAALGGGAIITGATCCAILNSLLLRRLGFHLTWR